MALDHITPARAVAIAAPMGIVGPLWTDAEIDTRWRAWQSANALAQQRHNVRVRKVVFAIALVAFIWLLTRAV